MLLTSHVLTGSLIGLATDNPYITAPTAFASHFALDSLPHFGSKRIGGFRSVTFIIIGSVDFILAVTSATLVCLARPDRAIAIAVGAFFAALPDLFYIPEMLFKVRLDKLIRPFHHGIQWGEIEAGILVDAAWVSMVLYFIRNLSR